ncbi:cell wall metabolism sensor histidine kinase WalK [Streptomyces sp. ST2-7A]|uniref:sensor histidine kinase n=1 Tax=Streptomyces sp. ST2-7A TaxID=2907214 RepID=UPI001F250F1E|nr:HAMP domain-containing sensor histidine kinase [Streptomyces sp. ST2-7A]MCE7080940.1 HAMP domain-containing histidine kinase [Streptomyces sp. ST2-7A]
MKFRTTVGATVIVALALLAASVMMIRTLHDNLLEQVDLQAENAARNVAVQLATGAPFDDLDTDVTLPVQVVDREGRVRAVSPGLQGIRGTGTDIVSPVYWGPEPEEETGFEEPGEVGGRVLLLDGAARVNGVVGDYRFAAIEAETVNDVDVTVFAGAPLEIEQTAVATVRSSLMVGFPALLAVVAGVTWLVTLWSLRPVEAIRREMAAITRSEDLSRRVPEPGERDEISRLAVTTNETLAALEASVERQRRFVADASHELRSPIASLRTQLEVGEAHPELLDVSGAVQDTVRLQALAADLLLLARLDAGEGPAPGGTAELASLAGEELAQREGRGRVPVTVARLETVTVTGSDGQLGRVIGNLLDNADRHAAERVRLSVGRDGTGHALVEVADDGSGVPEDQRERVFERFVRLDEARARDDGGAGLGLAIARNVAERHGGTLTVHEAPEGGALFRLRLPAVGGDTADADADIGTDTDADPAAGRRVAGARRGG